MSVPMLPHSFASVYSSPSELFETSPSLSFPTEQASKFRVFDDYEGGTQILLVPQFNLCHSGNQTPPVRKPALSIQLLSDHVAA